MGELTIGIFKITFLETLVETSISSRGIIDENLGTRRISSKLRAVAALSSFRE
jgi:hypothetical protein